MITEIRETTRYTSDYTGKKALDEKVMAAMAKVPRHEFIPESQWPHAYENRPLPIGAGQTISQPYIVALMTDLAGIDKGAIVLEVGTGSGYQAAVLAELASHVYTIEIIEELGLRAKNTLQRLGYSNIDVRIGDGYNGWPEHAPFDAILVTAAPETIPAPLIDQLKPGGRLVIPVGERYGSQLLKVITKDVSGKLTEHDVLPVGFVPFTGDH
jgi:protein-L-isoaspartate(D-aspartate) O-methyltransferase